MPRIRTYPEETLIDDLARRLAILEGVVVGATFLEGTGQFASTFATDVITHGLGVVPSSVFITFRDEQPSGVWVTTETSTTFTANRSSPLGGVVDFYWLAIP